MSKEILPLKCLKKSHQIYLRYLKIFSFISSYFNFVCFRLTFKSNSSHECSKCSTKVFEPLFTAADGWIGVTLIFGAFAFFWFVGIHGPSIVEPAIAAITYANLETNLHLIQAGEHADKVITPGTQMFVATMGGTGATLVVPFMFMWLTKSKEIKR